MTSQKEKVDFSHFEALDFRVGRIALVEESKARKPTYKITVDFGAEIGRRTTVGAFKRYAKEELLGKEVIGLVNVGERRMGQETSEFLMLGVPNDKGETVYLAPQCEVQLGTAVF